MLELVLISFAVLAAVGATLAAATAARRVAALALALKAATLKEPLERLDADVTRALAGVRDSLAKVHADLAKVDDSGLAAVTETLSRVEVTLLELQTAAAAPAAASDQAALLTHIRDESVAYAEQLRHLMETKRQGAKWDHRDKRDAALAHALELTKTLKVGFTRDELSRAIEAGLGRLRAAPAAASAAEATGAVPAATEGEKT